MLLTIYMSFFIDKNELLKQVFYKNGSRHSNKLFKFFIKKFKTSFYMPYKKYISIYYSNMKQYLNNIIAKPKKIILYFLNKCVTINKMTRIFYRKILTSPYKRVIYVSLVYGIGFGLLETVTRQIDIHFFLLEPIYKYTTVQQLVLTILWTPFIIQHKKIHNPVLRCLTFPINIYLCEIIGGGIMLYCFQMRAWHYTGKYAMFDGLISLNYYPYWVVLYFLETLAYKFLTKIHPK